MVNLLLFLHFMILLNIIIYIGIIFHLNNIFINLIYYAIQLIYFFIHLIYLFIHSVSHLIVASILIIFLSYHPFHSVILPHHHFSYFQLFLLATSLAILMVIWLENFELYFLITQFLLKFSILFISQVLIFFTKQLLNLTYK